jgi:hypothetical protein
MASPETIDQKTNRSYLESGLQPSVGGITQVRNVQTSRTYNPQERRGGNQIRNATNKTIGLVDFVDSHTSSRSKKSLVKRLNKESEDDLIKQAIEEVRKDVQIAKYTQRISKQLESLHDADFDEMSFEDLLEQLPPGAQKALKKRGIIGKIFLMLAYRKAFRLNMFIWSWGTFSWKFFQLPFALLSLAFLMAAVLVDEITKLVKPENDDGWIVSALKTTVGAVGDFASWVVGGVGKVLEGVFGFDPTLVDFAGFFVALWLLVMVFGIFVLFIIYLIYTISFLRPLSGDGAGAKYGTLLIALIGYSIPVLNLFPWFILWTLAVLRHPK